MLPLLIMVKKRCRFDNFKLGRKEQIGQKKVQNIDNFWTTKRCRFDNDGMGCPLTTNDSIVLGEGMSCSVAF